MTSLRVAGLVIALTAALAGCTDPYNPGQRALGGGAIGAGTGGLIGAIAGGPRGALAGALIGGTVGAVGGAATTPQPPPQHRYQQLPPSQPTPPSGAYQY